MLENIQRCLVELLVAANKIVLKPGVTETSNEKLSVPVFIQILKE
jgi:hypothetical protein